MYNLLLLLAQLCWLLNPNIIKDRKVIKNPQAVLLEFVRERQKQEQKKGAQLSRPFGLPFGVHFGASKKEQYFLS
jgi:hypothetical protein